MPPARPTLAFVALLLLAACAGPTVESGGRSTAPDGNDGLPTVGTSTRASVPAGDTGLDPATTGPATTGPGTTGPAPTVASTTVAPTTVPIVALTGWEAVDRYLDVAIVRGGSPAVGAAIARDGLLLHDVALAGDGTAVTAAHRFRVASISKTITAITTLRLVEDGVLTLDAPIGGLLAERLGVTGVAGVADLTVRQLLTHRSGAPQYEDLFFGRQVESCREAAAFGLTQPLRTAPGTAFRYSNLNFCLLGILIEEVTGASYEDVVDAQLLAPLGITGMRLAGTFDAQPGDVEHRSADGRNYMEVLGAAGAWIAPPGALVTILDSLDHATPGWKPLQPSTVAEMMTITVDPPPPPDPDVDVDAPPTTAPPPPESGYGMGVMIFGPDSYGHTGTLESTRAMVVHRPDGITWALTVSGDHPASTRQLARIMDNALLLGGFSDGTYETVPLPFET